LKYDRGLISPQNFSQYVRGDLGLTTNEKFDLNVVRMQTKFADGKKNIYRITVRFVFLKKFIQHQPIII
jgi:hypothetical protein